MQLNEESKINALKNWFVNQKSVLIAFSGGVDSTLLTKIAFLALGDKALAVTSDSASLARNELVEIKQLIKNIGIRHMIIQTDEFSNENYLKNPENLCYYCKQELFDKLTSLAQEHNIDTIVDGTNFDDIGGHRPGLLAKKEANVKSPFVELKITKNEIRKMSEVLGLKTYDKPSTPCLSSRVEYGMPITLDILSNVEKAEQIIKNLTGATVIRARVHNKILRIEIGKDERKFFFNENTLDDLNNALQSLGFSYITIDIAGYSSGNMNKR